jgi:putative transcriptional regulator
VLSALAAGKLLVATPLLDDPNFYRTVVLLCAHEAVGSFGLVLNRPLHAAVTELLPEWRHAISEPQVVFGGGPVERAQAFALARTRETTGASWWTPVTSGVGLLHLGEDLTNLDLVEEARLFAGYAGWSHEQLEAEVAEEAWFVVDPLPADAFTRRPERLWHDVLRRQPGRLSLFSLFPPDPRLN